MTRWKSVGVVALGLCRWAVSLRMMGPVHIVRARHRPHSNPFSGKGEGCKGGSTSSPPPTFEAKDAFKPSRAGGSRASRANCRKRAAGGPAHNRSSKRKGRLRSKVKDAGKVPDLSRLLREGLPYLTRNEATEMQLALAVSLYAHSKSRHEQPDHRVKAGVQACLQLGRLRMSRDALLAAILSGVLRPGTSSEQSLGFGRAPVTLLDIRQGFGSSVARLVAGVEHVTCVEETAHRILRGSGAIGGEVFEEADEVISPSLLIGVGSSSRGAEGAAGAAGGGGGGPKGRSLRDASALEQGEKLRNLIVSEAADWQVLTLRLAVHLQALKQSIDADDTDADAQKASAQLARDALLVHGPLAHRLGVHQLRNELESEAFCRLFPDQFHEVRRATQNRSSVYEKVVEATKETLSKALKDAPDFANQLAADVLLQHRIKSTFSMWKKMEKKKVTVEGVFDAVAVRVVLEARKWKGESLESYTARSEDLCYQAMSVIQRLYPSMERRLKDYIANPKSNGYQSLHATQLVPDVATHGLPVTVEFQVRSKEMHQKAEFGLAAHWSYKGTGSLGASLDWITEDTLTPSSDNKGPGMVVVPDSVTSGRELVDWLHRELQQRKVFVFGPDKRIWELDKASATAADMLGRSHMQSFYEGAVLHGRRNKDGSKGDGGGTGSTAWVNGQEVEPDYLLKNGDVCDVKGTAGEAHTSVSVQTSKKRLEAALNSPSKC